MAIFPWDRGMGISFSEAPEGDDENLLFSICEGKKQGYWIGG
mgnify:CR=1 FL=1